MSKEQDFTLKGNILVIDDDPENLQLFNEMLSAKGYAVYGETEGAVGIATAQSILPDLILLDVIMSPLDGYEVCEQLKADARTRDIPVIFISAKGSILNKVKAFAVGGRDYIEKTFEIQEILIRIENQLSIFRLQKQLLEQNALLQNEIQERQRVEAEKNQLIASLQKSETSLAESENRLRTIITTNADGLVVIDKSEIVRFVNPAAEFILGRSTTELLGQKYRSQEIGTPLEARAEIEIPHPQRQRVTAEMRTVEIDWEGTDAYLISLRDITERKQVEDEIQLLLSTTQAIGTAESVESALSIIAQRICEAIGWDVGEAWIPSSCNPSDSNPILKYGAGWYGPPGTFQNFQHSSQKLSFSPGIGLPGQVWLSRRPLCIEDLSQADAEIFQRSSIAASFGLKSAFAVPILAGERVLAVLVFFKRHRSAPESRLVELVGAVATQLGSLIARKQTEAALWESEERLHLALESSALGLWDWNLITGQIYYDSQWQYKVLGYEADELENTRPAFEGLIHLEDLPKVRELLESHLQGNIPVYEAEFRMLSKDGSWKWIADRGKVTECTLTGLPARMTGTHKDISEHKTAQTQVIQLLRQLQEAQALAHAGSWEYEVISQTVTWSDELKRIYGLSPDQPAPTLLEHLQKIYVDDRSMWLQTIERALATGEPYEIDFRIQRPGGEIRYLNSRGEVVVSQHGYVLRLFDTALDITERKALEREVAVREHRLNTFFTCAPIGLTIYDQQLRYVQVNEPLAQINGVPASEHKGKTVHEILPHLAPTIESLCRQVLNQGESILNVELSGEVPSQPGIQRDWMVSFFPLMGEDDSRPEHVGAVVVEITERKRAEAALRESQRRYQTLAEASPVCIFHTDAQGNCRYVNQRWLDITGLTAEFALDTGLWQNLHPADQERVLTAWSRAQQAKQPFKSEYRLLRPDGKVIWVIGQAVATSGDNGEIQGYIGTITDITDRKQAEEQLFSTRARLEYLLTHSPAVIFSCKAGEDYALTFMSENVRGILGYSARQFLAGSNFGVSRIHPEDLQSVWENLSQLLRLGAYIHEFRFRHADGRYRWMYAQLRVVRDSAGNPVECVGYWADISNRKEAEESLRASEATNRALLNAIPDMMFRCKSDGTFVDFKPAKGTESLGIEMGFLGKKLQEVWRPELAQTMLAACQEAIVSGTLQLLEYPLVMGEQLREYEARVVSCGRDEVIAMVRDITQRKQSEQALRESAERERAIARVIQRMRETLDIETMFTATTSELRQTVNCDRVAIYRFNPDWSGQFVAESVAEGWGSLLERQQCDPDWTVSAVGRVDCAFKNLGLAPNQVTDTYLQETAGGAYSRGVHYLCVEDIYQAGFQSCYVELLEQFQVRAYITVPIFCGAKLWGLLATYQNAGPRQWSKAEINIAIQIGTQLGVALQQAELLAQTKKQSEALQQAAIVADAANRAKSEFLANMSHELRTPLNAILGFTQVMSRDVSLSEQQRERLAIINRAGEHLLSLINDILELSKIEAGQPVLNEVNFNLGEGLASVQQMLELKAQSKGLELIFEISQEVPQYVFADEGKLRQVLMNILGNAIKFTDTGRVILRVSKQAENVTNLEETNTQPLIPLNFEIEDTGPGISAPELDHLFQPFIQTETGRNSQQGTGLGLPISRKFVQMMGGDIKVKSELGRGSLFSFEIQVKPAISSKNSGDKLQRKVVALASNQPEYRILAVDDTAESRLLLVTLLKAIGFQVEEAENGREAVQMWQNWEPHLICMDMRMPVMDGYEATRQIRASLKGQATAIIALTASAFEEDRKVILSAGCDDFIGKPFSEPLLLEKIREHLGCIYIYEEDIPLEETATEAEGKKMTDADLKQYLHERPVEWLDALYQASCQCNDEVIFELISQLPSEQSRLIEALKDLTNNFQFHTLMKLSQLGE